jgi:hypothetical protein
MEQQRTPEEQAAAADAAETEKRAELDQVLTSQDFLGARRVIDKYLEIKYAPEIPEAFLEFVAKGVV